MALPPNINPYNSVPTSGSNPVGSDNTTGKAGSHKVAAVKQNDVKPLIPSSKDGQVTTSELSGNVQPAEAKRILGAKDADSTVQSPEEQLNAILSDGDLAKCYKSQAKDLYFNASEYALKDLQTFMDEVDFNCDPGKMAKAFKGAVKGVRSSLKSYERDVSDLKVTVTTRDGNPVQLIPFKLKEISPEDLKELLGIALVLTKDAMKQRSSDSEYVPEKEYEEKISSCMNKIGALLPQVNDQAKETFKSSFKLLEFPMIEIHFDGSNSRSVEKVNAKNSSPVSREQNKLEVANTGEFYDETVDADDSGVHQKTSDPEASRRQNNIEKAKAKRKEHLTSETSEYTDETSAREGDIIEGVNNAIEGKPYSSLGGGSEKVREASDSKESPSSKAGQGGRTQATDGSEPLVDIQEDSSTDDAPGAGLSEETASSTILQGQLGETNSAGKPPEAPSNESFKKWLWEKYPKKMEAEERLKNSKLNPQPFVVADQQQTSPSDTSLLNMSGSQQRDFRVNKLCQHMTPDQVVKLFAVRRGLIIREDYEKVKDKASVRLDDVAKMENIQLPTYEALQEAEKKQDVPVKSEGHQKNSKFDSQSVSVDEKPQASSTNTKLLDMSPQQKDGFKKKKLWDYLKPNQIVKLFRSTVNLISQKIFKRAELTATVKADEIDKVPLPTLEELEAKHAQSEASKNVVAGAENSEDDKFKEPVPETSLTNLKPEQEDFFIDKKLWDYMTPDQIVKMYAEPENLIPKAVYDGVKGDASIDLTKGFEADIPMPTYEKLVEARVKQMPLPPA